MCEDRRVSDVMYDVIPPADNSWRLDVSEFCRIATDARDKAICEKKSRTIIKHYEDQVELWTQAVEVDEQQKRYQRGEPLISEPVDNSQVRRRVARITQGSLLLNIVLLMIKLIAYWRTGSTTILASLVDSILDLCSGGILIVVSCYYDRAQYERFPTGKNRFEPLGTLVFSCLMFVLSFKLLQEVVDEVNEIHTIRFVFDPLSTVILVVVTASKAAAAYICARSANGNTVILALADDHRNDVFANTIAVVGYFFAVHVSVWFDPILALVVTLLILRVWGAQILQQLYALSGHSAEDSYLNLLTVIARNHDFRVLMVDTVRAVTAGDGLTVEIDVVLPPDMPLCEAHDIAEHLQTFLESSPSLEVARAYVHADVETTHNPKLHR